MVADAEERVPAAAVAGSPVSQQAERRCSLRSLGKPRPSYILKPSPKPMKQVAARKKRASPKRLLSDSRKQHKDTAGPVVETEASAPPAVVNPQDWLVPTGAAAEIVDGKSAYARVKETLRAFNGHYLHFVQEEEQRYKQVEDLLAKFPNAKPKNKGRNAKKSKDDVSLISEASQLENPEVAQKGIKRASKRPDLKAITKMMENGTILYPKKIGHLPGIDIGHEFFSRAEMVVVGIHAHWLNGIDYLGTSYAKKEQYQNYKFPLGICVVLSGQYEDDLDNSDDIIYTGQGGHDLLGNKKQIDHQKMERGNLALKNNMECGVPVRVVRGHGSRNSYCGKVYRYDGLYQVQKFWVEVGLSGFRIFKYRLKRIDGQLPLTTSQVTFTRGKVPKSSSEIRGLVSDDITEGTERLPIPVTNVVDDPPFAPKDFTYCNVLQIEDNIEVPPSAVGCNCKGECSDPRICACARLNGGDFPYVRRNGGRLIEAKAVVFECGPNCGCSLSCINRVSQQGLKYHLEVFRTPSKGWAVRSWDTIPSGAPICEYTGILTKTEDIDAASASENNYIFDIDCLQTMKGLDGRERRPGDVSMLTNFDDKKAEAPEYCIDAGLTGNIARFINHSCQPNLFVQCVLSSHHDIKMARVMLFAADPILPLQELTYDYGYALDSVVGPDGSIKKLQCFCGATDCRKWLY